MHLNISCSTDNAYLQHCMAMLCSVFDNNKNHSITVHLLHNNLSESSRNIVSELCSRYRQEVQFYDISKSNLFRNAQITHSSLSVATYYRLILGSTIPNDIGKILYLDCDVIVLNDISELFEINLDGYGVAAVRDSCPYDNKHRFDIGIGLDDKMFCAGVLMINLKYWRENNCQSMFFDYMDNMKNRLRFEDQDVLNYTFRHKWLQLPYKYGAYPFSIAVIDYGQKRFDYNDYYFSPSIIHFATHVKPWLNIRVPLDKYYWKYVKLSGFPSPITATATKDTIHKIRSTKIRYYINTFIRPFIPNIIEIPVKDIFVLLKLIVYVFQPKKFKLLLLRQWLGKYHIQY